MIFTIHIYLITSHHKLTQVNSHKFLLKCVDALTIKKWHKTFLDDIEV